MSDLERITITIDAENLAEVDEMAANLKSNRSHAIRAMLDERRYILARYQAQGQRTKRAERMSAAEVGGLS